VKRVAVALLSLLALAACDKPKDRTKTATPTAAEPLPAPPAWAGAYMGKGLRDLFPGDGECVGNTDAVEKRYAGASPGTAVVGWGWDVRAKAPVQRVVLVDKDFKVVGAGETGVARPDVPQARPDITSPTTGWRAVTTAVSGGIDAYGLTDGARSVCRLGHLDL
jgi:hypothetical protein